MLSFLFLRADLSTTVLAAVTVLILKANSHALGIGTLGDAELYRCQSQVNDVFHFFEHHSSSESFVECSPRSYTG